MIDAAPDPDLDPLAFLVNAPEPTAWPWPDDSQAAQCCAAWRSEVEQIERGEHQLPAALGALFVETNRASIASALANPTEFFLLAQQSQPSGSVDLDKLAALQHDEQEQQEQVDPKALRQAKREADRARRAQIVATKKEAQE